MLPGMGLLEGEFDVAFWLAKQLMLGLACEALHRHGYAITNHQSLAACSAAADPYVHSEEFADLVKKHIKKKPGERWLDYI